MKDETIIRIITESAEVLSKVHFPVEYQYLHHSYNALLRAAKTNHPQDAFLGVLPEVENGTGGVSGPEMGVLFAQLRIALESLQESAESRDAAPGTAPTVSYVASPPGT